MLHPLRLLLLLTFHGHLLVTLRHYSAELQPRARRIRDNHARPLLQLRRLTPRSTATATQLSGRERCWLRTASSIVLHSRVVGNHSR